MGRSRLVLNFVLLFSLIFCFANGDVSVDSCLRFRNCSDCIQKAGLDCGWCSQSLRNGTVRGCINVRNEDSCEGFNKEAAKEEKIEDESTSKRNLISPQKVKISMRPNEQYPVDFQVMKDENDVDIYFLLDNTFSMKKYKKQLSSIADNLGAKISKYTTKYQFGFGAFDEKSTPPFSAAETNPKNFVHYLDLTNDTKKFSREVDASSILPDSVLNDSPEAGLDGLVQVINCKEIIGWRDGIMHLIIYISDASFHFAGDGIYAGIWKPYNASCQLEWDNQIERYIYQGLRYDYPSISEANYWLHQENKHLIFGVTKKLLKLYKSLDEEGALSSSTGDIGDGTGEDIHEIVISEFRKIADKLSIEYLHNDDGFRAGFEEVGNVECYPEKFPESTHLEQCQFVHHDCPLKFWHDRSETYKMDTEFETWKKSVYVEYFKEGEAWTPLACKAISAMYIVIICVSILVTIAIGLFVAYVIIVNLRDRREYMMFYDSVNDASWSTKNQLYESASDRSSVRQRIGFTNQGLVEQN